MLQTNLLLQKLGREITVIPFVRVMVLALCTSSDDILSMHKVLYNSLLYFQRYAPDKLNIAKIRKGSNSVNTGDRFWFLLAFCTFSDGRLLIYQVSFNSLEYFQRYAPHKLSIEKNKKESNSVNTPERALIFALDISLMALYQCIKFH